MRATVPPPAAAVPVLWLWSSAVALALAGATSTSCRSPELHAASGCVVSLGGAASCAHPQDVAGRSRRYPVVPARPLGEGPALAGIAAYSRSARKHHDWPVTPEVAGSSPVAPAPEEPAQQAFLVSVRDSGGGRAGLGALLGAPSRRSRATVAPDREPQPARARPACLRRELQHPQATPRTRPKPPVPSPRLHPVDSNPPEGIQRCKRLGGLVNEYARGA